MVVAEQSDDAATIAQVVHAINSAWPSKHYEDIASHLATDVVIAPSGSPERIRGRDAYVQSYRDYDQQAETLEFSASEVHVDVFADIAVASTPFKITYRIDATVYREDGIELLVFRRDGPSWRVVWRTMHTKPV